MSLHELVLSDEDRALLRRLVKSVESLAKPFVFVPSDLPRTARAEAASAASRFVELAIEARCDRASAHAVVDAFWDAKAGR